MKQLVIQEPGAAIVTEAEIPKPQDNEILIRVDLCGICGTDIHIFEGEYLGDYPVVPGHEFAGTVEKTGSDVTGFRPGDRVAVEPNLSCGTCSFCIDGKTNFCSSWQGIGVTLPGGMAEYTCAPQSNVFHINSIPSEAAIFMEPLSCVLHGIGKLSLKPGMEVFLAGAGPIGILILQVLRTHGVRVTAGEPSPDRRRHAEHAGAAAVFEDSQTASGTGFDIAIDATGIPSVMEQLIPLVKKGGELLYFGVPPERAEVRIPAFRLFEYGLSFHGSYTSVKRSREAVSLLDTGNVNTSGLLTHTVPLERFEEGIGLIRNAAESGAMKVAVKP